MSEAGDDVPAEDLPAGSEGGARRRRPSLRVPLGDLAPPNELAVSETDLASPVVPTISVPDNGTGGPGHEPSSNGTSEEDGSLQMWTDPAGAPTDDDSDLVISAHSPTVDKVVGGDVVETSADEAAKGDAASSRTGTRAASATPAAKKPSPTVVVDDKRSRVSAPPPPKIRAGSQEGYVEGHRDTDVELIIEDVVTGELDLSELDDDIEDFDDAEAVIPTEPPEAPEAEPDASGTAEGRAQNPPPPPAGASGSEEAEVELAVAESPGAAPPPERRRPWFEDFFNDDYLRTVIPPTAKVVRRECDFIERTLGLERGATILDVGCGLGLHAVELSERGYLVVGLDISLPMLSRAADEAQDRGLKINFLHGDMREMEFEGAFDAVLCWGTTFGYFDDEGNKNVVQRLYRSLKPKGLLLLDVTNRDHVIGSQPNLVWFEGDGCVCMEETNVNYFSSRLEVKRTVMLDDGMQWDRLYSIRLYALHELGQLLHAEGFRVAEVTGRTATPKVFFGADSPRLMILAERRRSAAEDDAASTPDGASDENDSETP